MASIKKITNNTGTKYVVSYELPRYIDGKRRKTTKTFPVGTKLSEVKEFLAQKELERKRGTELSLEYDLTFDELAKMYFSTYTQFLSPTTYKCYLSAYNNSKPYGIKNYFGNAQVRKIKGRHIQEYVNTLCSYISPKSIKNYMMLLRVIFDIAVQEKIIQREANPMLNKINKPKLIKKPIEAYTLEEFNLILKLADEDINPTIKLILNLALLTGMRRGELGGLMWNDINFEEGYIFVRRAKVDDEKGKKSILKEPKTQAGIRKIYVPQRLLKVLKEAEYQYKLNKLKYGKDFKDEGFVLSKPNGEGYTLFGISNNYHRFMKRNCDDIRYLKFHGLRHTYASILIEQGENPKTVQHNLGHSDVALTLQVYSHSYESAQKKAAEKLELSLDQIQKSS